MIKIALPPRPTTVKQKADINKNMSSSQGVTFHKDSKIEIPEDTQSSDASGVTSKRKSAFDVSKNFFMMELDDYNNPDKDKPKTGPAKKLKDETMGGIYPYEVAREQINEWDFTEDEIK